MQNRLRISMQIVDALRNIECELLAVFPGHLDAQIVQQGPQTATRAILEYDAQVRLSRASTKEKHNVGVSDDFHYCAFILEFFEFLLFDDLLFNFFNGNDGVLPTATVDDTVATFGKLVVEVKLIVGDLIVLDESTGFVTEKLLGGL